MPAATSLAKISTVLTAYATVSFPGQAQAVQFQAFQTFIQSFHQAMINGRGCLSEQVLVNLFNILVHPFQIPVNGADGPVHDCLKYFINREYNPLPLPGPNGRRARVINALVLDGITRLPDISLQNNHFDMINFMRVWQHLYAIGFVKSQVEASWANVNKSGSIQEIIDSII